MVIRHNKVPPMQCYHIFSDTRDVYLSKNHYGSYSPQMLPVAEIPGSGSWPISTFCYKRHCTTETSTPKKKEEKKYVK